MVYGLGKENPKLTDWHKAVNEAAFHLSKDDPNLLYDRAQLKTSAEEEARKTYVFKKASGSRSAQVNPSKPKRAKISSSERSEKIASLSIQRDLIKKQISSKQQLCNRATAVKDFTLCGKLQGEMRSLFKEKENLESSFRRLQKKARKSDWYEKKKRSSLPPAEGPKSGTPSSMDIRKLFTTTQESSEPTSSSQTHSTEHNRVSPQTQGLQSEDDDIPSVSKDSGENVEKVSISTDEEDIDESEGTLVIFSSNDELSVNTVSLREGIDTNRIDSTSKSTSISDVYSLKENVEQDSDVVVDLYTEKSSSPSISTVRKSAEDGEKIDDLCEQFEAPAMEADAPSSTINSPALDEGGSSILSIPTPKCHYFLV